MSRNTHIYALFDDRDEAIASYRELQARGCASEHCSAILHERHIDESALSAEERATREGALKGALKAGSTGVVIAGLFALGGGVVGIGPLAIVAIGGGLMAAYGVVVGSISSADEPERHLRALERDVEDGKVLIAVETDDEELQAICEDIFAAHHGRQIIV
ncbi:MAG: hypothetical protein KC636_11125 [Myxococcales bacterium]|nr:hypothetical protein [Myxococcales bacterium]